ncbi:aminotransferase [Inquilinus limosus]|uniref:Aminotransferase n=1 Tax=Inquilinus limosus MP06 TaxID=1398085 RepID=A0A0A0D5F4_9PROT|nr:aminotransferase [Inquilinus limosus]KGM32282.1 aminotransferase [Inquilinus limosus MP06]
MIPNSTAARDVAYLLHPYTNLSAHREIGPLVISRGKGIHVYDEEGREYIEGLAGLWCAGLGFDQERLVEAATRQMRQLPFYHAFGGKVPDVLVDLAEALIAIAPKPLERALFVNSGSEANDLAVKIAWYVNNALGRPEKKKIIARRKGYHGVTVMSGSLTGLAYAQDGFDLPVSRVVHVDTPHHYHGAAPGESEEDYATRLAEQLEATIQAEGPETVAAFIAEPVMGAGGVIVPPRTYFEKVQAVLRRHDILFIADEVICGFARTGNWFGCDSFGIRPDIMTVAKQLSAGFLPIAATLISGPVYEALVAGSDTHGMFGHGNTYGGHPVAAAVALETLKIYREMEIVDRVRRVGASLQEGLRRYADHPLVGEVRGLGLIAGAELVADKAARTNFDKARGVGAGLVRRAQAHGLLTRAMPGDVIGFCPPMVIDEAGVTEMLHRFELALDETWSALREAA